MSHGVRIWTLVGLALELCGCWGAGGGGGAGDAGDVGASGRAGTSGVGGFSGSVGIPPDGFAGTGFAGSFGGDPGFGGSAGGVGEPCPAGRALCAETLRLEACGELEACGAVPGLESLIGCAAEINEACVDCVLDQGSDTDAGLDADAGTSGVVDCGAARDAQCMAQCALLTPPPVDEPECETVLRAQPNHTDALAECVCSACLFDVSSCVADDDCWRLTRCFYEQGCFGERCPAADACLPILEEVGVTSFSAVLGEALHRCALNCAPTVP